MNAVSNMSDTVIKIENLSKQYRLGIVGTGTLSHDLNRWWHLVRGKEDPYLKIGEIKNQHNKVDSQYAWALRNINIEVKKGEVLGIIGKNGAGKSTLLKILSRVTGPTTGSVKVKGRISSLLEVGTGFHPELTGKENVFLNGAILGMTRREIEQKLAEIIDFSGIAKYINTPVKRYSSGMKVRLAFSVAAFLEPEVLIVDEVLAVGDFDFQEKALGKIKDISAGDGRTVLFVSHNMASIANLCSKCLLMENGIIVFKGTTNEVIQRYLSDKVEKNGKRNFRNLRRKGTGRVILEEMFITDENESRIERVLSGMNIILNFRYSAIANDPRKVNLGFSLHEVETDKLLTILYSSYSGIIFDNLEKEGIISMRLNKFPFAPGKYLIKILIIENNEISDSFSDPVGQIIVEAGDFYDTGEISNRMTRSNPMFLINGTWKCSPLR